MSEPDPPPFALPEKLHRWLEWAAQVGASDLHLVVGHPPVLRLHGDLSEIPEPALAPDEAARLRERYKDRAGDIGRYYEEIVRLKFLAPPEVRAEVGEDLDALRLDSSQVRAIAGVKE